MLDVNDANFNESVEQGKFLLMFYTDRCPVCPAIIEILTELEHAERGKFQFAKINFDVCPNAVAFYNVPCVPTVLAVRNGKALQGWCGAADTDAYRRIVDEVLTDAAPQPYAQANGEQPSA